MLTNKLQFLLGKRTLMIAIWPLIIVKKGFTPTPEDINHEKIHFRQQLETLFIPFIIWYCVEFLVNYIKYSDFTRAYLNISFEREAYNNQDNLQYLKTRKPFSFLKYL